MKPVIDGDENNVVFDEVIRTKEVGGPSAHDEGTAVDIDHDGTLIVVSLGRVDVQVEAVLVTDWRGASHVVLWTDAAIVGSVELG